MSIHGETTCLAMNLAMNLGGCQSSGPFLDPYCNTAPSIYGTPKGIIVLTPTHMVAWLVQGLTQGFWVIVGYQYDEMADRAPITPKP